MPRFLRDRGRKCRTQMLDHWTTDAVLANSIQIIVRLRPAHAKAVLEGRGQGGLFARETIRDGQEAQDEGHACLGGLQMDTGKTSSGDATRERCEWLQVQFGVRVLPYQLSEVRARMSPNRCEVHGRQQTHPGTATVETRTLAIHPKIVDMLLEWSRKAGVPWPVVPNAPDPRQRTTNGQLLVCCCGGPLP